MNNKNINNRLLVLDGIRGLAIIFVFFNHISSDYILNFLPNVLKPIWLTFISSGKIGVAMLFILSAFLMTYLYPKVNNWPAFWQKRYTRIFPLFLSAVITRFIFRNFTDQPIIIYLLAIFIPAFIIHFLWIHVVRKYKNLNLSTYIFWGFIALQLVMIFIYGFVIMRQPAINFNQLWSFWIREPIIALVNLTLSLFMGDYIPMLDGVYWALIGEVLFYVVYPILFAPLNQFFLLQKKSITILFLIILIPFTLGLVPLSFKIFQLNIINFSFLYYFIFGIILANVYRKYKNTIAKYTNIIAKEGRGYVLLIVLSLIFILINYLFYKYQDYTSIIRIVAGLPLFLLFITAFNPKTSVSRFFQSKYLLFLGTISYSIYLVHTSIVDIAKMIYVPTNYLDNLLFILCAFLITVIVARVLFYLLERPYFIFKNQGWKDKMSINLNIPINPHILLFSVGLVYMVFIAFAYQSNYNFFSQEYSYNKNVIQNIFLPKNVYEISLRAHPIVKINITSFDNNLGIVSTSLKYIHTTKTREPQYLIFKIKEKGQLHWYATSRFNAEEIGNSKNHPFGFPLITDSKKKEYIIEIELENKSNKSDYLNIDVSDSVIKSVHQLNKSDTIKDPYKLLSLLINKFTILIHTPDAQKTFSYGLPYILFATIILVKKKKYKK